MVLFLIYDEDGAELDAVTFTPEDLGEEFDSVCYTDQDLDELGYRLCDEINDATNFTWEYVTEGD